MKIETVTMNNFSQIYLTKNIRAILTGKTFDLIIGDHRFGAIIIQYGVPLSEVMLALEPLMVELRLEAEKEKLEEKTTEKDNQTLIEVHRFRNAVAQLYGEKKAVEAMKEYYRLKEKPIRRTSIGQSSEESKLTKEEESEMDGDQIT
jgi:flagellar basal body P-ring protein FlgI